MAVWVGVVPPQAQLSAACPLRQGGVRLTYKLVDKLLTAHLLYDVLKEEENKDNQQQYSSVPQMQYQQ